MSSFRNLTVANRLILSFGALVALLLAVAFLGWLQMRAMRNQTFEITSSWLPSVAELNAMNTGTSDLRVAEFQHVLNTDASALADIERSISEVDNALRTHDTAYQKVISTDNERQMYERFSREWAQYMQIHQQVLEHSRKNENAAAKALLEGDSKRLFDNASKLLEDLIVLNKTGADEAAKSAEASYATARTVMFSAAAFAALLAVLLTIVITRSLTAQLGGEPAQVVEFARAISDGNLTVVLEPRAGDTESIVAAMHSMRTRLSTIVSNVRGASESVSAGARQLSQGNDDLSQRTQEQAAALEETAASMEEMTSTVKQNSDNAREANSLASGARTHAERGGQVVANAVGAMSEINDSSRKIADIIGVIDEIAFQTNLLALNAAVEAARAGEQGRGFAVVASEVRSLAQRSATAAREIKTLIGDSVEKVRAGTELVDESGKVLNEIMESIKRVSNIVAEIAAASEEQAAGIDQVNNAMTQMDQTTQQNAALVEEAAAAAKSMEQQAVQVVQQVAFFKSHAQATVAPMQAPVHTAAVVQLPRSPSRPKVAQTAAPAARKVSGGGDSSWQEF